jgi:hypothetical protein
VPASVTVNRLTVVHKTSNGISQAFPDVCKTPAPPSPSPVPIPYPNIAMSTDAADTASSVKADGNPIMLNTSKYAMSTGDEAGSLFGVMSNKVKGSANPQMWSMDVKAEGKNVFRQLDIMLQNGGSKPINTPPGPNNQPPRPGFAKGQDPEKWKIAELQWSDPKKKCGDMVKIRTKTENYPDGVPIAHVIHESGSRRIHAMTKGKAAGNSVDIDWITVNGKWKKQHKKLKVKAHGGGGVKESSNELEIEIPEEFQKIVDVKAANNTHEILKKETVDVEVAVTEKYLWFFTKTRKETRKEQRIVGTGDHVAWDYKYTLSLEKGVFRIHCKIKLDPQHGVKLKGRKLRCAKKSWKKEIEAIWDNQWREHRNGCQRGKACNCSGGCCMFPIRVKCSFVASGQDVTVSLWPGAPKGSAYSHGKNPEWWDCYDWYERVGRAASKNAVRAHEFGHNIGLADEYEGGSVMPEFFDVAGSIMQSGTKVMKQHWDRHPAKKPGGGDPIHKMFLDGVKDKGYGLSKV